MMRQEPSGRCDGISPSCVIACSRLAAFLLFKYCMPGLASMLYAGRQQEVLMDFGLFYYCQGRGVPHDQAYHEMLDQIVLAETLGFGECWFAEHHFTDYSLLPSPNLMIASAVQRTEHMRFGNYVNAMSFHNPLRLAAEAAMLDNLARGRFDFG